MSVVGLLVAHSCDMLILVMTTWPVVLGLYKHLSHQTSIFLIFPSHYPSRYMRDIPWTKRKVCFGYCYRMRYWDLGPQFSPDRPERCCYIGAWLQRREVTLSLPHVYFFCLIKLTTRRGGTVVVRVSFSYPRKKNAILLDGRKLSCLVGRWNRLK